MRLPSLLPALLGGEAEEEGLPHIHPPSIAALAHHSTTLAVQAFDTTVTIKTYSTTAELE